MLGVFEGIRVGIAIAVFTVTSVAVDVVVSGVEAESVTVRQ